MLDKFVYFSDLLGCAVFAISGVLVAGRMRMDTFGVLVLATVTAVGGGTIRDMALGATPVFWIQDTWYLLVIISTAFGSIFLASHAHQLPKYLLPYLDAFGLALFTVIGAEKTLALGHPGVIAVMMGLITGVAGGVIRDLLAGRVPLVLQKEIYATASIFGGVIYTLSRYSGLDATLAMILAIIGAFCLRVASIHRSLSLPSFKLKDEN